MTSGLIDFHCHLDLFPDFERLVAECERLQTYTLAVTTTPRAWSRNKILCERTRCVRPALGLHPQLVEERWQEIDLWESLLPEARYVGEVGLDAGPKFYRSLNRQKQVFERILRACEKPGDKILSVHSVRAAKAVLDMVEQFLPPNRGVVVLHWFTGTAAEARRAAALGCYFSINEQMLRNERGITLVRSIQQDRLLTETDGPFTTIEGRPARPADVGSWMPGLASCLGMEIEACIGLIRSNLDSLVKHA